MLQSAKEVNARHDTYARVLYFDLEDRILEDFLSKLEIDGWKKYRSSSTRFDVDMYWQNTEIKLGFFENNNKEYKNFRKIRKFFERFFGSDRLKLFVHNNSGAEDPKKCNELYSSICNYLKTQKINYDESYKEGLLFEV